ncbi:hypothetical protein HYR99_28120 [Candidatus Poribacteria bacterium]|nr:hypothetical protein [Candidatus Poribacteria bacterium]
MAQYDITSKVLFQDYKRDFIALTLGEQDFEILGPIPIEFPSVQMRMTDAPMRVRLSDGTEAIVHIEFQTETSADPMEFRIAEYVGRILHEYHLPVYVTVIYLSPSAGGHDPGGYGYNRDDRFAYALRYQVIRIGEIDGQTVLDQKSPIGLIPLAALMKRPPDVSKTAWLDRCVQTVLEIPLESEEKKRDYVASFCVLSNLVYEDALVQALIKEVQLMIDIENSAVIKMFTEKVGIKERAEGSREGEVRAYTDALLQILQQEFGRRGMQEVEPRIRAIDDEQKLASLITPALQATSVEAFKKALEQVL